MRTTFSNRSWKIHNKKRSKIFIILTIFKTQKDSNFHFNLRSLKSNQTPVDRLGVAILMNTHQIQRGNDWLQRSCFDGQFDLLRTRETSTSENSVTNRLQSTQGIISTNSKHNHKTSMEMLHEEHNECNKPTCEQFRIETLQLFECVNSKLDEVI